MILHQGTFHPPSDTLRCFSQVCDEAYEAYLYRGTPTYLSALSGGYGVVTIHTFSKTLGTGLRLGYVHSAPEMLAPIRETSLTQVSAATFSPAPAPALLHLDSRKPSV